VPVCLLLSVIVGFVVPLPYGETENAYFKRNKRTANQCQNDPSGTAPYTVPPNQYLTTFVPNVPMKTPYASCTWIPDGAPTNPAQACPPDRQNVFIAFIPLFLDVTTFLPKALLAQTIIRTDVNDQSTIVKTDPTIHTTLDYFTCYNDTEVAIIQRVMSNFVWHSFTLTINNVSCDVDTEQAYITAQADESTTAQMGPIVHALENQIAQNGVTIRQPRVERFHMTLAYVTYQYPSDCIVQKLQKTALTYGSKKVCCFFTQPSVNVYFAHDCNDLERALCAAKR